MRKKISLLPYIRENIYGVNKNQQIIGWEINKFNIQKQWKKSTGENVIVSVIDTGCDLDHDDIKSNIIEGKNFVEIGKDPIDKNGHGTHVAGTIAANNNGVGMVGVAPDAKIRPIKALSDSGHGNLNNILSAIKWAADIGSDFITMSLGAPNHSDQLENAIRYAHSKGCVIFCAAGNSGENTELMYPAKYKETISIGAIDENLERTKFTCSGEELDFLAPGHNILSCVPGNNYAIMTGTSMSNPFAVGCAALLGSYYKNNFSKRLTQKEYIEILSKNAIPLKDKKYSDIKKYQGYGIINPTL